MSPRRKATTVTLQEKVIVLDLLKEQRATFSQRISDHKTVIIKHRTWEDIAHTFNSVTIGPKKTPKQIRRIWEQLKKKAKKIYAEHIQFIVNDGLSRPPSLDPMVEDVISIFRDEGDNEVKQWEAEVPSAKKTSPEDALYQEEETLAKLVMENQDIICNRESSSTIITEKSKAWSCITQEFNTSTGNQHTTFHVHRLWEYVFFKAKCDYERFRQKNDMRGHASSPLKALTVILMPLLEKEEEYSCSSLGIDSFFYNNEALDETDSDSASEAVTLKCEKTTDDSFYSASESSGNSLNTVMLHKEANEISSPTTTSSAVALIPNNSKLITTTAAADGTSGNCCPSTDPPMPSEPVPYNLYSDTREPNSCSYVKGKRMLSSSDGDNLISFSPETVTLQSSTHLTHKKKKLKMACRRREAYNQVLELNRIKHRKHMKVLEIEKVLHRTNLEIAKLKKKYWEAKLSEVFRSFQ